MIRFQNVGIFIRENVWLEPNVFPYKYPNILKLSLSSYLPAYEDGKSQSVPKRRHIKFRRREIKPILFPYKYPNILKPSGSSYLPAYKDGTDSFPKRRHIKFRHREINPNLFPYKYLNIL